MVKPFVDDLQALGDRLGSIVWQFTPARAFDADDLGAFLDRLPRTLDGQPLRDAVALITDAEKAPRRCLFGRTRSLWILLRITHRHNWMNAISKTTGRRVRDGAAAAAGATAASDPATTATGTTGRTWVGVAMRLEWFFHRLQSERTAQFDIPECLAARSVAKRHRPRSTVLRDPLRHIIVHFIHDEIVRGGIHYRTTVQYALTWFTPIVASVFLQGICVSDPDIHEKSGKQK
jgi:hypothetical protein